MRTLITALATPYFDGKVDTVSYGKLVEYQLASGVDALLAVGTTAEAQLLTVGEKTRLIKMTKRLACNVPVWVGVGGVTAQAIREARLAESLGADGLLIAPPAFVKCTPKGYIAHVRDILNAVSIPIMLYNAPSRCNYVLSVDVVTELATRARYLKDAGKNIAYTATLSDKLTVLCGNDGLLTKMLTAGATGVVSVVSNVAPQLTRKVLNGENVTKQNNEYENDCKLFRLLSKLSMLEVSPIAIKYMLYKKGIFANYNMRLPLTRASQATQRAIDKAWEKFLIE